MKKYNVFGNWQKALLTVIALLVTVRLALACGGDAFVFAPDGSGTPSLEYVVNSTVADVGNVTFGANDGTITQTQTLRMDSNGLLLPDNSCSANTAFVLIEKTGILNMKGGAIETVTYKVNGPVAGDAALGGLFTGFGSVEAKGAGTNTQSILFQSATINPVGTLSISSSRVGDKIVVFNSKLKIFIGGATANILNVDAGAVQLTNTKLQLDFPAGFSPAVNEEFTLVQMTGGSLTGVLSNTNGVALNEGDTVTVNGIDLKITYAGGVSHKDIVLYRPSSNTSPTISAIANQTTKEDVAKGPIAFTVNDAETPGSLTLTAASSNTTLLPVSSIALGGSGTSRTVTLTPAANKSGSATVTLTVSDGNTSNSAQFTLTVTAVNDPPVVGNQSVTTYINQAKAITLKATDVDSSTFTYTVTTAPTHGTLSGTAPNFTYTPTTDSVGSDSFVYRANDGALNSNPGTVNITVKQNPKISIADKTITEGNTGTTNATFTVTLSEASTNSITVNYATANGTAVATTDYTTTSGTLTFTAGQTSKTLTVPVVGDVLDEDNETYKVNLSGAVNATIADTQAIGTITDDDAAVSISIADKTVTETDSGTVNVTFAVTLSAVSGRTITVNYATVNGTAVATTDYTTTSGTLTFTAGQTSKTLTVPVVGDVLDEENETFKVNLSSAVNATIADTQAIGTITDNDAAVSISINDVNVTEANSGTSNAMFTIKLSAASGRVITVKVITADATARSTSDYTAQNTTLTFSPGQTSKNLVVPIIGDTVVEADEIFKANLSSAVNASVSDAQGICTILNDD